MALPLLIVETDVVIVDERVSPGKEDNNSIVIRTIEMALHHRQIHSIIFYLDSRERELFRNTPGQAVKDGPGAVFSDVEKSSSSIGNESQINISHIFSELNKTLTLILSAIEYNLGLPDGLEFGQQLLETTIVYLGKIVKCICILIDEFTDVEQQNNLNKMLHVMTRHLATARQRKQGTPKFCNLEIRPQTDWMSDTKIQSDCDDDIVSYFIQRWKDATINDIIRDGVYNNAIPLAQAWIASRLGGLHDCCSMTYVCNEGKKMAHEYLDKRELYTSSCILTNLGCAVDCELKLLCFATRDKELRDFLLPELDRFGSLSSSEVKMLEYVHKLEKFYPCPHAGNALDYFLHNQTFQWDRHLHIDGKESSLEISTLHPKVKSLVDEISPRKCSSAHHVGPYSQVSLDWVNCWTEECRQMVLLSTTLPRGYIDSHMSCDTILSYLTLTDDWTMIERWMKNNIDGDQIDSDYILLDKPLPVNAIENIHYCTDLTQHRILNTFAKRDIFCDAEVNDLSLMLRRLVIVNRIFSLPAFLCQPVDSGSNIPVFHQQFIRYCVERRSDRLLAMYIDHYKVSFLMDTVDNLNLDIDGQLWLTALNDYIKLSKISTDRCRMSTMSLSSYSLLIGNTAPDINSMLEKGYTEMALATLMYYTDDIDQILKEPVEDCLNVKAPWFVDSCVLKRCLQCYPKLEAALFPKHPQARPRCQDITAYQLLQGNVPFDVSIQFGWQSTNMLSYGGGSQLYNASLPNFSHPGLVSQHGVTIDLGPSYYLMNGQPSFAFTKFLNDEAKMGILPDKKSLLRAKNQATMIALRNFNTDTVAAACVAFIEMLNEDSVKLRIHLQSARLIFNHENKSLSQRSQYCEELADKFVCCIKDGDKINQLNELKTMLEEAVNDIIQTQQLNISHYGTSSHWNIVMLFCIIHSLPLSQIYLRQCAENNEWTNFLVFSQTFRVDKATVSNLTMLFPDTSLRAHLQLAIENAGLRNKKTRKSKEKSSPKKTSRNPQQLRSQYYLKLQIGKDSSKDGGNGNTPNKDDNPDSTKHCDMNENYDLLLYTVSSESTVFDVLFHCFSLRSPWKALLIHSLHLKAPLLSVLAACYKTSLLCDCFIVFILSSTNTKWMDEFVMNIVPDLNKVNFTLEHLNKLIKLLIKYNEIQLLIDSYEIFDNFSPVLSILRALKCMEGLDIESVEMYLTDLQHILEEVDTDTLKLLIGDMTWVKEITIHIFNTYLSEYHSKYHVHQFIRMLSNKSFINTLNPAVDYRHIYEMLSCLSVTRGDGIDINISQLFVSQKQECDRVLKLLQQQQYYDVARSLSVIVGIETDLITIAQALYHIESCKTSLMWTDSNLRDQLWTYCNQLFVQHTVKPHTAAKFFMDQADKLSCENVLNIDESALLYSMACCYMREILDETDVISNILFKSWTYMIDIGVNRKLKDNSDFELSARFLCNVANLNCIDNSKSSKTELLPTSVFCNVPKQSNRTGEDAVDDVKCEVIDAYIGQLLKLGLVSEACNLASMFQHHCQDLLIVISCIKLADRLVSADSLEPDMADLLNKAAPAISNEQLLERIPTEYNIYERRNSVLVSGAGEADELVLKLENLASHCHLGQRCCQQIIANLRAAQVLGLSYESTCLQNELETIRMLLLTNDHMKYMIVKEFIQHNHTTENEVAEFLCYTILDTLKTHHGLTQPSPIHIGESILIYNPCDNRDSFQMLLRLCKCPSNTILAEMLLDAAECLVSTFSETQHQPAVMAIETELLIRIHDCYSASCHVEGIAAVLKAANKLTGKLAAFGEFTQMMTLLTGIGRYDEMTYVFEAMLQCDQFEAILFGKSVEKVKEFRLALLQYLRRYHPDDKDKYTMVCLHFSLYREIGEMLERRADKELELMKEIPMETSSELHDRLKDLTQVYIDAGQNYREDGCGSRVQKVMRQARLVALQIHLLNNRVNVLNLDKAASKKFIYNCSKFNEALTVAEAYDTANTELSGALYHNVIIGGDLTYLEEYKRQMGLEKSIISDLQKRFERDKLSSSSQAGSNFSSLLLCSDDMVAAYNTASTLKLINCANQLIERDTSKYLIDYKL